eukprot:6356083-Amphidinium_carterae.1
MPGVLYPKHKPLGSAINLQECAAWSPTHSKRGNRSGVIGMLWVFDSECTTRSIPMFYVAWSAPTTCAMRIVG